MTRKWAYIFAILTLALVAVVIYAAVHIPGLQRTIDKDQEVQGRLAVVAAKVMPGTLVDYPITFSFEPAYQEIKSMVNYRIEANPEAQQEIGQAIMAKLDDVHSSPTQSVGEFVDNGYAYTVLINPASTQTTIVVVDNGPVAQ